MTRILEDEIANDPLGRGYAGMTDTELIASGNTENRTQKITNLSPRDVFNAIDQDEWSSKTDLQRRRIWDVLHLVRGEGEGVNLFGAELTEFRKVFDAGSVTASELMTLRVKKISRMKEIGWGVVREKDLRTHTLIRA